MQRPRAMRPLWWLVMLGSAPAVADPVPANDAPPAPATAAPTAPAPEPSAMHLPLHAGVSVRGGFHHTHVDKGDGAPTGYGPKVDVELTIRPIRQLILAGFLGYSSYASDHLFDGVTRQMYGVRFKTWALGGRIYVEPLPQFFVGLGVFDQSETERSTSVPVLSHEETHVQYIVGGNVVRLGHYTAQVAATYTQYDQFDRLEHVVIYGLVFGIHGE